MKERINNNKMTCQNTNGVLYYKRLDLARLLTMRTQQGYFFALSGNREDR